MKYTATILGLIVLAGGCDYADTKAPPEVAALPPPPVVVEHALKPEMIITFTKGNLACSTLEDLQAALEHGVRHENTRLDAMMVGNGGPCFMVLPEWRVKLIDVRYNTPTMPDMAAIEFVREDTPSSKGAWAISGGAEPASPVKTKLTN